MCPRQHYILESSKHYIHTYKQSLWMCSPFLPFAMCFNNNIEAEVYTEFAVEVANVLCIWNKCSNFRHYLKIGSLHFIKSSFVWILIVKGLVYCLIRYLLNLTCTISFVFIKNECFIMSIIYLWNALSTYHI